MYVPTAGDMGTDYCKNPQINIPGSTTALFYITVYVYSYDQVLWSSP